MTQRCLDGWPLQARSVLQSAPSTTWAESRQELVELALGGVGNDKFQVAYEVPGLGRVVEAEVVRCKNGLAVNYVEPYMRRRDPDCMVIADDEPTDKPRFRDRFGHDFDGLSTQIVQWLSGQELVLLAFDAGGHPYGYGGVLIAPKNASFFAAGLSALQSMIPASKLPPDFAPCVVVYLAPPFRHTHCQGRQVVVHRRSPELHEMFALNLYPGPSAKKGIYGALIHIGEHEGWTTLHGSTVEVETPYDNLVTIMHEGASGGGKSEMLEYPHREIDGRLLLGENVLSKERRYLTLTQGCKLHPVTDDMALCHPTLKNESGRIRVTDAEDAWFVRVDHITDYGVAPDLERICIHPPEPLVFLNIRAVPQATSLIWEHTEDSPGVPCPNPRVILPRRIVPGVLTGPVDVDVRSLGVRTPPCTRREPTYGILGVLHYLPPALGWLWRMVSPRGHANPSITDSEGMSSEGVGSYWPFATGRRVDQANLLLRQIAETPKTRFVLTPNQYVGAWKVGFMPQWLAREYLARRGGARFRQEQLVPARCPLLGYALYFMQVEGTQVPHWLLEVDQQTEVGPDGYDAGAKILRDFFKRELHELAAQPDLDAAARRIVECCLDDGSLDDYVALMPVE
ncbi:MAG: DUF4914 family protein [Thermoguttaceae bacterium]